MRRAIVQKSHEKSENVQQQNRKNDRAKISHKKRTFTKFATNFV